MKWVIVALVAFIASSTLLGVSVLRLKGDLKTANASVTALDGKLTIAKDELSTCKSNTAQLQVGIADQNAMIQALRAESDRRAGESRKALADARKTSRQTDAEVASALNRQPRSAEYCEQAREAEVFLRGTL